MSEIQFPAVIVMSAIRRRNGNGAEVVSFADNRILENDADLQDRIHVFKALEEGGAAAYTYTLAEVANVATVIDEQRRALEFEAGLRASPDPEPEPMSWAEAVDRAAELARVYFGGQGDAAALARLPRAIELAKGQNWTEEADGWTLPGSRGEAYRVNGVCTCPDYTRRGVTWCKHRIARCLARRARDLQKDGAGSARNTPAPELVPEETTTQEQNTTTLDLAQLTEVRPLWGGGLVLTDLQGQRIQCPDLGEAATEPALRAAGWEGPMGQGYWRNPTARDWAAIDGQIKAQAEAMIERWQARHGAKPAA